MPRQLNNYLCLFVILFISLAGHANSSASRSSSSPAGPQNSFKNFTTRILNIANTIRASNDPSALKIKKMDQAADELEKEWDQLMRSGSSKDSSLKDPQSPASQAFQAYTHFILLTKMKASGTQPPTREDCTDKKLQMEFDYPPPTAGNLDSKVKFSEIDKTLNLLRKSICHE